MICWAAGGDMDIAYTCAGQVYFKYSMTSWHCHLNVTAIYQTKISKVEGKLQ